VIDKVTITNVKEVATEEFVLVEVKAGK